MIQPELIKIDHSLFSQSHEQINSTLLQFNTHHFSYLRTNILPMYKQALKWILSNFPNQLLHFAFQIVQLSTKQRIEEETQILMKATENFQFFKTINAKARNVENRIHQQCCQIIKYRYVPQGEIIFKQNDAPSEFYIILQGGVNIYMLKDQAELENDLKNQRNNYSQKTINEIFEYILTKQIYLQKQQTVQQITDEEGNSNENTKLPKFYQNLDETKLDFLKNLETKVAIDPSILKEHNFFFKNNLFKHKFIVNIQQGQMFGELGILLKKPRAATIVAHSDCHLAVIDSQDYTLILENAEYKKIQNQVEFFIKYLFVGVSKNNATKYSYNFEKVKFIRKQIIFNFNDASNYLYFIKKGEVKLYKQAEKLRKKYCKGDLGNIVLMNNTISHLKQIVEIGTLEKGQIFGEIELIDKTCRQFRAICHSQQATIFRLHHQIFMRILSENAEYKERFYQQYITKKQSISEFLENNQNNTKISPPCLISPQTQILKFQIDKNAEFISRIELGVFNKQALIQEMKLGPQDINLQAPLKQRTFRLTEDLSRSITELQKYQKEEKKLFRVKLNLIPEEEKAKLQTNYQSMQNLRNEFSKIDLSEKSKLLKRQLIFNDIKKRVSMDKQAQKHSFILSTISQNMKGLNPKMKIHSTSQQWLIKNVGELSPSQFIFPDIQNKHKNTNIDSFHSILARSDRDN